jgi:putative chitinase
MFSITSETLRDIAGASVNKKVADELVKYLPEILEQYGINTRLRVAHFLAQLAHESDHFRTLEEYASGSAYEGRRDLGNTRRGDGRRYKGRGPIQVTGRFNYRKYGQLLGVDLENNPELAATPRIGLLIAAEFWKQNRLNELADDDNGKHITRRINGGYNGLNDRLSKIKRAKNVLSKAPNVPKHKNVTVEVLDVEPVEQDVNESEPKVVESSPVPLFIQMDTEND